MALVGTKPVFGVSNEAGLKPVSSANRFSRIKAHMIFHSHGMTEKLFKVILSLNTTTWVTGSTQDYRKSSRHV